MTAFVSIASQIIILLLFILLLAFMIVSINEKQKRAALKTIPILLIFLLIESAILFHFAGFYFHLILVVAFISGSTIVLLPFQNKPIKFEIPAKKFDERDIMFSRMELKAGTKKT